MRKLFGRIPPVGNPITIKTSNEVPVFPGSLKTYFLNSGTAALAAGLKIAQQHCRAKHPEVIIPAYCCPDLLSAILYNNMKPVLVDFIPGKPYMDLDGIEAVLNENTVAVIAVNFLGIPERLKEIKSLLTDRPTLLIEDSAQWFPENDQAFNQHKGDLVVYSFGKGKPISLLGGGALSVREAACEAYGLEIFPGEENTRDNKSKIFLNRGKYLSYNLVISPCAYWLLELAPFIKLGDTCFHPLTSVEATPDDKLAFLSSNIHTYQHRVLDADHHWQTIAEVIETKHVIILKDKCPTYEKQRLLRLPLLFEHTDARNLFLAAANRDGLGASPLYREILLRIRDVPPAVLTQQAFPHAEHFSKALLTLPTHSHLSLQHARATLANLN